jgi:hypothetical protein
MVISDREVWACAHVMIRQHGADAGVRAAMRVDALLFEGELEGAGVWRRIVRAINALEVGPEGSLQ